MSRGPGRPPIDKDARRTTRRVTRVTQSEAERIDAAAEAADMSVSDWLRWWAMQGVGMGRPTRPRS